MSNKEINLQALLSLDEQIQRELGAMEANVSQLPRDGISRDLYSDYMARFNRIRTLFDRTSDILRDAPLEQTNPDLYDILLSKERISANYNVFNGMLGRFTRQYNKELELDEGRGERTFAPSSPPAAEDEPTPEEETIEETPDGPSDEEIEAALAEEEAAEVEAAEKKKKAAKKAHQEKAAQEERDAIERDRAQKESELRNREDQRRMDDRRLEDDRLAQDRARDAMLASELYKAPYDEPTSPDRFYPEPPAYEPPPYERTDRGFERYPEDRRHDRAPEYDRSPVNEPPRYAEQDRFYPPRHEEPRHEPQYPGKDEYPEPPRYEDRHYETSRHEVPSYTHPSYPEYEDRRQAPQSAADKRDQELRDADQRAREAQRLDEMHRERDARFERYRERQQSGGFTREEQQFGHFDYSAREGETGRREHGHSDYKSFDFRDDPTYTAHEYAPGGTTQRPMTIGSMPRNDAQRFYSAPHSSTQYNYLPGGGIAGAGISAVAPTGAVSYYNSHRDTPPVQQYRTPGSQIPPQYRTQGRNQHLPHSYRPLSNTSASDAANQPRRVDPVNQLNKVMAARNVMSHDPVPTPVPAGPRHFYINAAKSDPKMSQISDIPGYFRRQQEASFGSRKAYILNSMGKKGFDPSAPGSMGGSGQSKDGASNGNGPRRSKVEETSADLLNRKSKIRTESIAMHYSRIIAGKAEGYAAGALMMASRKFYNIAQSGEDNALRTLEQGRYYGTVAAGLASAYMHRKPVSSAHAIKTSASREFREFGRFSTMSKKQLTHDIHESLKANRQLKNEIRELTAKGSSLTVAERAELLKKRAQLMANSMEPRKMHGYRNMQAAHARDILANKQIEKASEGGRITTKTVQKAMQTDFKAREASMTKKFGHLNRITDRSLRLEIQQQTQLGRVLKKEIKELKALQASGAKLTAGQAKKLQELLKKHEANNKYLRQLHGLKKARLESNLSQKALQNKMTRLAKNQAAIRGGLYALYGIITRPIREGSEIGAQGLLKFANVASNHYVHEFVKRSMRAAKKTYLWGAKITGFNKTKIYTTTSAKAKKVSTAMKGAPKKVVKATGRVVKKGAIHTYQNMAPVKVKTAVTSAHNRYTGAKGALVAFKTKTQKWVANTWVGRTYSSVSHFFGKIGRGISSALNVAKAVLAKAALIMLMLVLLFQLITMIAGSGGSVSGSIILSPYEGPDGKLDLGPYSDILDAEWDAYMDSMQEIGDEGGFYKTVIDMDVNPDNVREILSMMAVRFGQDIDLDTNPQVKEYLQDLLRASHPYWTETDTITCDNIDTCTNKVRCSASGSQSRGCSHGHWTQRTGHGTRTEIDPKTGESKEVSYTYTYHTWTCDGHCGGHPQITFHVNTITFDAIFGVDPHGAPTSSSATMSNGESRGNYTITYYCNEKYPHTCNAGPPYKTATGAEPTPGRTIAVDPHDIPLGTHVFIDGHEYVAEDTGGAVDGKHIDILVNTHAEALQKGTRHNVPVYNIKYDGVSMMEEGEWSGWTEDNREWVMAIYEQDWTELYCGIPNVTDAVGTETDLSGVKFVNGSRPGHQSIVNIARSQEGQVGGRPYWSWYGWDSRVEWCACFVSWCANQDGVLNTKIPKFALCSDGVDWFAKRGQWAKRGDTIPVAGDIIFFSWNSNSKIDHVGIVVGSDGSNVYTIEGNNRDKCRAISYPLNSSVIYGYGLPNY